MPITPKCLSPRSRASNWRNYASFNAPQELVLWPASFAGIMALVGMSVVLCRALKGGEAFEAAVVSALTWMAILGSVGFVVGALAQATVDEAVRHHMERELAATITPSAPGSARG